MSFSTVPDKANLSTFYESDWDTYLKDNINWIHERKTRVWDHTKVTSTVSFSGSETSEAAALTVVTGASLAYDNQPKKILFFCPQVVRSQAGTLWIALYRGATSIGKLLANQGTMYFEAEWYDEAPSAATYSYIVKAWHEVTPGGSSFACGTGGAGVLFPMHLRVEGGWVTAE